jgi:hypothetical protein
MRPRGELTYSRNQEIRLRTSADDLTMAILKTGCSVAGGRDVRALGQVRITIAARRTAPMSGSRRFGGRVEIASTSAPIAYKAVAGRSRHVPRWREIKVVAAATSPGPAVRRTAGVGLARHPR